MSLILFLIGLIGSSTIALIGYFLKAISPSGVAATIVVGTIITLSGNLATWAVVVFLFASSLIINLFKHLFFKDSFIVEKRVHEKKGARDASQILANTLPGTLCLFLFSITTNQAFLIAYLASLASATSDTWGSEIGILSSGNTIDLTTFKKIPKGLSGGISLLGTSASFLGSCFSYLSFFIFNIFFKTPITNQETLLIISIGFLGSLIDSFLGSSFQATYQDNHKALTEQAADNHLVKGYHWLNNDRVNLITNSLTAIIAYLLAI